MNRETFSDLIRDEVAEILALNNTKGREYADDQDALRNFTRRSSELDVSPFVIWQVLAGKHWDAIVNYCRTGKVHSEPIEGRIRDLLLYCFLLLALIRENKECEDCGKNPFPLPIPLTEDERKHLRPEDHIR